MSMGQSVLTLYIGMLFLSFIMRIIMRMSEKKRKFCLYASANVMNRLVFKGLALLHLGQYAESEAAYSKAARIDPVQMLAWQGLEKAYESQKNWLKLMQMLEEVADLARRGYVRAEIV